MDQCRCGTVLLPLRLSGILRCYVRGDGGSLFREAPGGNQGSTLQRFKRRRGQLPFDGADQLLNVNGLGEKWMPVYVETSVCLGPGDERSEKNDRRVLQFRVGPDLCGDFASIAAGRDYIKEDYIRPKIPGARIRPGRIVLFTDQIAARLFEENFDQMSSVL